MSSVLDSLTNYRWIWLLLLNRLKKKPNHVPKSSSISVVRKISLKTWNEDGQESSYPRIQWRSNMLCSNSIKRPRHEERGYDVKLTIGGSATQQVRELI